MPKTLFPQQDLADRLQQALEDSGVTQAELARACGVSDQAVNGWVTTGRIAKHHLPMISHLTKKPLEYFLVGLKTWRRVAAIALPLLLLMPHAEDAKASAKPVGCVLCKVLRRLIQYVISFTSFSYSVPADNQS